MNKIDEIERIQKNVLATMEFEGLKPSEFGFKTTKEFLEGKITSQQAITRIKSYWLKNNNSMKLKAS